MNLALKITLKKMELQHQEAAEGEQFKMVVLWQSLHFLSVRAGFRTGCEH